MKIQTILGIILIIAGAVLLTYDGFNTTERQNIIDAGPLKVQADVQKHHDVPPAVGWATGAVGVILLVFGLKGK